MSSDNTANLKHAYRVANAAFERGQVREALELLRPAIAAFSSAEGDQVALIKPLIRSADCTHRLEGAEEAHRLLDRALTIAGNSAPSPSFRLAEALCLVALVEWNNKCGQNAIVRYEAGIAEGEQAGASEKWLGYHLTGLVELLLDTQQQPGQALAHATRAVELTETVEGVDSRAAFYARIALGRAQLVTGASAVAEKTFEALLEAHARSHRQSASGQEKLESELKDWLAQARGV